MFRKKYLVECYCRDGTKFTKKFWTLKGAKKYMKRVWNYYATIYINHIRFKEK